MMASTLRWIDNVNTVKKYIISHVNHCLISKVRPPEVAFVGYIHYVIVAASFQ